MFMIIKIYPQAQKCVCTVLAVAAAGVLLTACRTPEPSRPEGSPPQALRQDDSVITGLARLNGLLGITARSYAFDLQPTETLAVTFHAQKNGVDEPGNTFTHVVDFGVYQKFDRNYPTYEPQEGKRLVDIEILEPGHSWNPDLVKVAVRLPGFDRYFYYERPTNSSTEFSKDAWISRGGRNVLLKLRYQEPKGNTRTLTVEAEIRSNKSSS
jgi:hypothetical protein